EHSLVTYHCTFKRDKGYQCFDRCFCRNAVHRFEKADGMVVAENGMLFRSTELPVHVTRIDIENSVLMRFTQAGIVLRL
ncbi:hypothetical protein RA266_28745, partial [Pseudomonas syringae pv. tagetis]|uniref:hypothetical protein n=1 Tax=Pseudomonas syringae group genomosp. 7 TaxID=251699 RepID=UPI00376FE1B6